MSSPIDDNDKGRHFRDIGRAATAGTLLVGSVLIGYVAGEWVDSKLGTNPIFMVVGVFMGMIAGFVELAQMVKQIGDGGKRKEQ